MKINKITLLRSKYRSFKDRIRILKFKLSGLHVGAKCIIGDIICDWPNKITIGDETWIENNVLLKITNPFSEENKIVIGNRVFIGSGAQFNCNTQIIINDDCLIASNTVFVDAGHEIALGTNINEQALTIAPIVLEKDVWIGTGCIILKGVVIGEGSVIGAGSLVNKSIPSNQVWAGTPAKFLRNRI